MLSAIRKEMKEEVEQEFKEIRPENTDLNGSLWKDVYDKFKAFYEIFNTDRVDLTKPEDVVKSIIFTQCYCKKILRDEIKLNDQRRECIIRTLINILNCVLNIIKHNDGLFPRSDPLFPLMCNSRVILNKTLNKVLPQ